MDENYEFQLPGQYRYEDMLLCEFFRLENVLRVQKMELEPSDVVIASYPKTGTTLLQEIVWLIRNNGDVSKANQMMNIARVPFMEAKEEYFQRFQDLPHPRHMKTHLPYRMLPETARQGKAKIVYIIRNPKDCLVSYYHFHRMNEALGYFKGSWEDFFSYFKKNNYLLGFGNPLEHMKGFWEHKDDKNVHIVAFEDIINKPEYTIIKLAEFLECELDEKTVKKIVEATRFDVMKSNPMTNMNFGPKSVFDHEISPFMRKGQIGDWKNYFNDEQNEIMDKMEKEKLAGIDLEFVFE